MSVQGPEEESNTLELEAAHEAIILVDEQAKVVSWNGGAQRVFGWSAAEMQGRPIDCLLAAQPGAAFQNRSESFDLGAPERLFDQPLELRGRHKDGREFLFDLCFSPCKSSEPRLYRGVIRDLTPSKNAETALRQQADLLDLAHDAIFVRDLERRITFWNTGAVNKYGWAKEEALGQYVNILLQTRFPIPLTEIEEQVVRSGRWEGEVIHFRRDGSPLVIASRWAAQRDEQGQVAAFFVINTDITARKKAEEESHRAHQELEKASAAKSEFLSRMSHELRTPLNAILGFAQLLELEPLAEEQADNVQQILKGGEHLLSLINEILDIARIEAGHLSLSLEPVPLQHTLTEVIHLLHPLARGLQISLSVDFALPKQTLVFADQQRLKQVLLNLISNAIKYNRQGGRALIRCRVASSHDVRIEVNDSGQGIAPDQIERLFNPFERLDAQQSAVQGTGLGLALSKRLVEAMNGEIGVFSTPEIGSTFWVQLPLVADDSEHLSPPLVLPDADADAEQDEALTRTVLYIDDNAANLRLLERLAARQNDLRVVAARQGMEGIELARRLLPDLILLDIHLPDLSGDVVLKRLKSHGRTAHIPIVMLSADDTPGYAERLLESGADAYLAKPLDSGQFLKVLDETLNGRQLQHSIGEPIPHSVNHAENEVEL